MKRPDDGLRLRHMLDASKRAIEIARERGRAQLDEDDVLALALARLLEIVGEAARGVSSEFRSNHPEIPWRSVIGTRDHLAHGYFDVNLDIVWSTITTDLPPLVAELERFMPDLED